MNGLVNLLTMNILSNSVYNLVEDFMNELFSLILVGVLLIIFIAGFVYVSRMYKRRVGTQTLLTFGATDEYYNKEQKEAIEMIVDLNVGKKMEEQSNDDSKD